ncbi:MAG: hypothetical protein ACYDCK_14860 [Thermoplasmatota archaeon]
MNGPCYFLREYVASENGPDRILLSHIRGCPDCRDQVKIVDSRSRFAKAM